MNYSDIQLLFYQLTKTTTDDVPVATLNLYTQPAEDDIAALMQLAGGSWPYDDSNQTDLPHALFDLVSGVQDYNLGAAIHGIDRIEIKDTNSKWRRLSQYDQQQYKEGDEQSLSTDMATSGMPTSYRLRGTSAFLSPIPNYSQTASLKVYHTRGPLKFDYTTGKFTDGTGSTSSVPGFPSLFHELIPLKASRRWAVANLKENAPTILEDIERLEFKFKQFLGTRNRDRRRRFTPNRDSNK